MNYNVERLEQKIGEVISITNGERTYEQIFSRDHLTTRVFPDDNGVHHGVIFKPGTLTREDYPMFRELTDRLKEATGIEIRNGEWDYMEYISHKGIEHIVDGITMRVNVIDRGELYRNMKSFLNRRTQIAGCASFASIYTAGFLLFPNQNFSMEWGAFGGASEFVIGLLSAEKLGYWRGSLSAPGSLISRSLHRKNCIENPDYFLIKFIQNYGRLQRIRDKGSRREFRRVHRNMDRYFQIIKEAFLFAPFVKGFSISYQNRNKQQVLDFLEYMLKGGNIPQLQLDLTSQNIQGRRVEIAQQESGVEEESEQDLGYDPIGEYNKHIKRRFGRIWKEIEKDD